MKIPLKPFDCKIIDELREFHNVDGTGIVKMFLEEGLFQITAHLREQGIPKGVIYKALSGIDKKSIKKRIKQTT